MDASHAKQLLEKERGRLQTIVSGISEEHDLEENGDSGTTTVSELSSADQHQSDLATETFEREKDFAVLETMQQELQEIEAAFARLDDGSYGSCETCGKPIGEDRLQARPTARLCVDDQKAEEQ